MAIGQRGPRTRLVVVAVFAAIGGCAQVQPAPEAPSAPQAAPPPSVPEPAARPAPKLSPLFQHGRVSIYGDRFAGRPTASGDIFDPQQLTMAHRTLPFGTHVRVTNLANHKSVEVVVNDRGPFVPERIADLSAGAARLIGLADGVVDALIEVVEPAKAR